MSNLGSSASFAKRVPTFPRMGTIPMSDRIARSNAARRVLFVATTVLAGRRDNFSPGGKPRISFCPGDHSVTGGRAATLASSR